MSNRKPTQVRVYLDGEAAEVAEKIADSARVDLTWLCRQLVVEGLKACKDAGDDHLMLPLKLRVDRARPAKALAA